LSEGDIEIIRQGAGRGRGGRPIKARPHGGRLERWTTQVNGVNGDFRVRDWALTEGRNFTEASCARAPRW
jgi:hypothetical protein